MKRYGYLYEKVYDKDNLRLAILQASKGKLIREEVQYVLKNIELHVDKLHYILTTHTYIII